MNIIKKHYPHDDHIFIFDNTPTHVKRASDAISACNMPINPSAPGKNWLVKVLSLDNDGKQIFDASGKRVSKSIPMAPGTFAEGTPQLFYFPDGHRQAGQFKGMRIILEERGFLKEELEKLKRECLGFHCPAGKTNCCTTDPLLATRLPKCGICSQRSLRFAWLWSSLLAKVPPRIKPD